MHVSLLQLANFMFILILSTALHEGAHAWTADHFGDSTPRENGRMTLNPFAHLDPMMSILIPGALFAMSGSLFAMAWTPINPFRMRNPKVHGLLCALAGPTTNLVIMAALGVALGFEIAAGGEEGTPLRDLIFTGLEFNAFVAVFNFLPVPPLDGGNIIQALLPARFLGAFYRARGYAFPVFLVLMLTGMLEKIVGPPMNLLVHVSVEVAVAIAGALGG